VYDILEIKKKSNTTSISYLGGHNFESGCGN
jgi:hypothetical protein